MAKKKKNKSEMKLASVYDDGPQFPRPLPADPQSLPPGVIPTEAMASVSARFAQDSAYAVQSGYGSDFMMDEGLGFLGYQHLAQLSQRAEYRRASEIVAQYMTKNWIDLVYVGSDEGSDEIEPKLKQIEAEFERLNVQEIFKTAALHDGLYGRAFVAIDTLANDTELRTKLTLDSRKVGIGSLSRLIPVEPIWTYPANYNSNSPMAIDFYRPSEWYVLGKPIHVSRTLQFVGRPVSDALKPAYQFGGVSMTQMSKPYVDNWLRTRQSVADLIESFTVFVLKTNMSSILNGGAASELQKRANLFTKFRGNHGLNVIDQDTEDFMNLSVPLGGLDALQAQAQEQMCSVFGIPLVIFTGIASGTGLSNSGENELKVFYNWIKAQQESMFSPNLKTVLDLVQLNLFGEINDDIKFEWRPLFVRTELEIANERKLIADTDALYVDHGVLAPEEIRIKLASDTESGYEGLDVDTLPDGEENFDDEGAA